jgi:hypothetical protein
MALEDEVQRSVVKLLQWNRQHTEGEVRAFVSELLTAAARERAAALQGWSPGRRECSAEGGAGGGRSGPGRGGEDLGGQAPRGE